MDELGEEDEAPRVRSELVTDESKTFEGEDENSLPVDDNDAGVNVVDDGAATIGAELLIDADDDAAAAAADDDDAAAAAAAADDDA